MQFPIVNFVVVIRIIRNVIVGGFVLVSGTIIEKLFQCNKDCYYDYCYLIIAVN